MPALLLKRLRQSELGWFKICRTLKRETGRQRGLNLDTRILEQVFGELPEDPIPLKTRYFNGDLMVEDQRPLRHQQKNWRLTGEAVEGDRFATVAPDDIVLLLIEPVPAPPEQPQHRVTWDVISQKDRQTWSLFELGRRLLGAESVVRAGEEDAARILQIAGRRLRSFGGGEAVDTGDIPDEAWDQAMDWLLTHMQPAELSHLAESGMTSAVAHVLQELGETIAPPSDVQLVETILRRFGTDLLADRGRRDRILAAALRHGRQVVSPERWRRGNEAAQIFVSGLGLPIVFCGVAVEKTPDHEDVDAFSALSPLHPYQLQIAEGMREILHAGTWEKRRAIAWLPTGTGKTRVTVETLLMECILEPPRNCIVWIADRDELCEQAIETFRHVWMIRGRESRTAKGGMVPTLRVIRLWGGRPWQEAPIWPTVVVASVQTLAQRLHSEHFQEHIAVLGERAAAVVFDEAHHLVARSWSNVVAALGLSRNNNYLGRNRTTAPPLLGLTATPARSSADETEQLSRKFEGRLLEPAAEWRSLASFQKEGFLSHLRIVDVPTGYVLRLSDRETQQLHLWQQLPGTVLERAGSDAGRTARIIEDLESRMDRLRSVLVFACSVEHAHTIAGVLERRGVHAAALDGESSRAVRWQTIQRFRSHQLQVLINYDLLATGFDAPNVDAVAIARPVASRVLFAQMIGRGLRGPKNGGTPECMLLDYRDDLSCVSDLELLRESFREGYLRGAEGS